MLIQTETGLFFCYLEYCKNSTLFITLLVWLTISIIPGRIGVATYFSNKVNFEQFQPLNSRVPKVIASNVTKRFELFMFLDHTISNNVSLNICNAV